jgi:hypothetical protein
MLFLVIRYWEKDKKISAGLKIAFGMIFFILGLLSTGLAIKISMQGHLDKGVQCVTGIVIFIPISFFVNFIGIPLILILEKSIRGISNILPSTENSARTTV